MANGQLSSDAQRALKEILPTLLEHVDAQVDRRLAATLPEVTTAFCIAFAALVWALHSARALDYVEVARALERALDKLALKDRGGNGGRIVRELIKLLDEMDDVDLHG